MNRIVNHRLEYTGGEVATFSGVGIKSGILLLVTLFGVILGKVLLNFTIANESLSILSLLFFACPLITLVLVLVISFVPNTARVLAVPYAFAEGISIGVVALVLELAFGSLGSNIVLIAFIITIGLFSLALALYVTGVVKVTSKLRAFAVVTILGIISFSIFAFIANLITGGAVYEILFGGGMPYLGIIISLIMIVLAGIYSIISFDNARLIVDRGLDKRYEWYASFGIILNLIYMYWRVLRLLIHVINSRR